MKIKTSELTGAALDWAVAKALGVTPAIAYDSAGKDPQIFDAELLDMGVDDGADFDPSSRWAQGGPIIERGEIDLYCHESPKTGGGWWVAEITGTKAKAKGNTPLIAAMRCFVASKLGDEVEVPEELLP